MPVCPLWVLGVFFEVAAIVDGIHAIETQPNRNNAVCPSEQLKARRLLED